MKKPKLHHLIEDLRRAFPQKNTMKKPKLHPLIDNLIQIAESKGINRNQVAVRSGVSPSVVGRIFSGERTCTVETFAKLVAGIGCEVKIK